MKQTSLLFAFILLLGGTTFAQEVEEVQTAVITKKTATWCINCGTWGWDLFETLVAENQEAAVLMAAHYGGSQLENETSAALVSNLGGAGQPRFFFNNDQQSVSSSNIGAAAASFKTMVDATSTVAPVANTGMIGTLEDQMLTLDAKVRFFQEANGEFYLGVYILENNYLFTQTGQSGTVPHKYYLSDRITAEAFGDLIVNGAVAANDEFTFSYTKDLSDFDLPNVSIAAIIYQKNGAFYDIVNAWQIKEFETVDPNALEEVRAFAQLEVAPNPAATQTTVRFELQEAGTIEARLINTNGQIVWSQRLQGQTGLNQLILEPQTKPAAGVYTLQLVQGKQSSQRSLIWR